MQVIRFGMSETNDLKNVSDSKNLKTSTRSKRIDAHDGKIPTVCSLVGVKSLLPTFLSVHGINSRTQETQSSPSRLKIQERPFQLWPFLAGVPFMRKIRSSHPQVTDS